MPFEDAGNTSRERMTQEKFEQYLSKQGGQKLNSIAFFKTGQGGTHRIQEGKMIETTEASLARLREQVAELDQLLKGASASVEIEDEKHP